MKWFLSTIVLSSICLLQGVVAQTISDDNGYPSEDDMGPVTFLWPSDRKWSSSKDNNAPCGSSQTTPYNRTYFPMTDGSVAIVAKEDAWNITVKIAYSSDPTANSDFETTLVSTQTSEEDPGHVCYSVADAPSSVTSGSNATLQLIYVAPEGSSNDTYYVCADIQYIQETVFDYSIPCFNATVDDNGSSSSSSSGANFLHGSGLAVVTVIAAVSFFVTMMW